MSRDRRPDARRSSRRIRAVQAALRKTFTETNRRHFRYGLSVRSASPDLVHIDVALGFLSGEIYCCSLLSCDIPFYEQAWWRLLRQNLEREGVDPPARPITLHVAEFKEPGAVFPVLGASASDRFSFHEETLEEARASAASANRRARRAPPLLVVRRDRRPIPGLACSPTDEDAIWHDFDRWSDLFKQQLREEGLPGLLERYKRIVARAADGPPDSYYFYDYTNDLSMRSAIKVVLTHGRAEAAGTASELEGLDRRLRASLRASVFVWNERARSKYPAEQFWWYYGLPASVHGGPSPADEAGQE